MCWPNCSCIQQLWSEIVQYPITVFQTLSVLIYTCVKYRHLFFLPITLPTVDAYTHTNNQLGHI